jgi:hypothetical protein
MPFTNQKSNTVASKLETLICYIPNQTHMLYIFEASTNQSMGCYTVSIDTLDTMYELLKFVNGKQKLLELQRNLNCIMICFTFWILFLGASLACVE